MSLLTPILTAVGQTSRAYKREIRRKNWSNRVQSFKVAQGYRKWHYQSCTHDFLLVIHMGISRIVSETNGNIDCKNKTHFFYNPVYNAVLRVLPSKLCILPLQIIKKVVIIRAYGVQTDRRMEKIPHQYRASEWRRATKKL